MWTPIRALLRELLPPFAVKTLSRLLMRFWPQLLTAKSITVISTPCELDEWIRQADAAHQVSDDALRQVLASFRYRVNVDLPSDPFSREYAAAQFELYRRISGRARYEALENERTEFHLDSHVRTPFPYSTFSSQTVGSQLVMQGLVIKSLSLPLHSRILEFGPGWGNLTLHLARMGHHVTAVDILPDFVELIRRRARQLDIQVDLVCQDMLAFQSDQPYDAVVFFESFHHCADHLQLLRQLQAMVVDDGVVIFGFEPITETPDPWGNYPWGIRLDGMSVWSARKFGWLELGYTDGYFLEALRRTGWRGEIRRSHDLEYGTVVIARKLRR
jgi:2-polyprenyl-3-methyl-5-hydroxy-6-metoxy-1,4-benzoquinol methylase